MGQPTAAEAKLVDKNDNPQIADRQSGFAFSVPLSGNYANDYGQIGNAISAIRGVLQEHGLIDDTGGAT
jgi:hypothetical protein